MNVSMKTFVFDASEGNNFGRVAIGERRYEGYVCGKLSQRQAWRVARRIFYFLEHRFAEILDLVGKDLVPATGIEGHLGVTPEEATQQIVDAICSTNEPTFYINDIGYSTVYFNALAGPRPPCVGVLFDESGEILTLRF